jgi:hypothetical protein
MLVCCEERGKRKEERGKRKEERGGWLLFSDFWLPTSNIGANF